ncbi:hypothetical protein RB653_004274 [Dictyostelium firmibasis]|uniref:Poly [ADP-ribose] polymerase n=1 Tax=Dictyostelium firmibasis TaxID=79012 RepID=A0AAN7TZD3_9MYCE
MEKEKFASHEGLRQTVEYSKSARSSCKKCRGTIAMDTIRVGVETPSRVFDGYDVKYYHLGCIDFPKLKIFYINQLKHYELLRWDDQLKIRKTLGQSDDGLNLALSTYYNEVWRVKDILIQELKPAIIKKLFLEFYPKLDSSSPSYYLHFLADGLSYGRIGPCPSCNGLTVLYDGKNYYCKGFSSSFSRCNWHGEDVKRYRFLIPKELMPKTNFFKEYTFSQIHPYEVLEYKETAGINSTNETEIPTFSALSISDSQNNSGDIFGSGSTTTETNSFFYKMSPIKKNSILLKVDPSFSRASTGEILVLKDDVYGHVAYNVLMNLADLIHNSNSYYILQIIKTGNTSYWVYCKWGRVGVNSNGGTMEHSHTSLNLALKEFNERFTDKTGIEWNERANYKKQSGKYAIIDLEEGNSDDYPEQEAFPVAPQPVNTKPSKLSPEVQSLVTTLFDAELMKKSLSSLQFDVQKMPLGMISQNQINQAYSVLNKIQDLLESIEKQTPLQPLSQTAQHNIKSQILEASTRFYTYIPHRFEGGLMSRIPPIDNRELLVKCIRLVDTLSEIEVVNQLKRLSTSTSGNSIDDNYNLLKADIKPLERESFLYRNIEEFALSTVDQQGLGYSIQILDIFKVDRTGDDQFAQWESNSNRMLLFHGSRIQSWCSILPNGLKIASPLSPKSGYRLGKGVYLADCISLSGLYTGATKENPMAVIAICDVALGNSAALYHDTYMEDAQPGYHSTKAFGKRQPALYDQLNGCYQDKDEFIPSLILKGPIIETGSVVTSFTHNEYVIYNNSQCRIKYLLKLKLDFN